jgi:predicted enzyme related to lactoylglutathione lyase
VLRRANSEEEARKIFAQAEAALDSEKDTPVGAEYRAGQVTVGIVKSADVGLEFAPNPAGFALRVPDVDAAREHLADAGVELTEVYDTGVCRLAFFSDPDGNRLVLHRRYAP